MFPNAIRYEVQLAGRTRLPAISYAMMMKMLKESRAMASVTQLKSVVYERAIGQHLFKSEKSHVNPTRFGDFEVKGRTSDF